MVYSLARHRRENPSPPFWLGGEYRRLGARHWLADALGAVEVGAVDFQDGDLISVRVEALGSPLRVSEARLERRSDRAEPRTTRPHAAAFARFVNEVRGFFLARGLQELATPTLVVCPGLEPTLEPFATTLTRGRHRRTLYLPTSPEIHLKKAMAEGWTDIFEIRPCFRREEVSAHHASEFTMIEWYRGFADLDAIVADLRDLLTARGGPPVIETDFAALFGELLGFELRPGTTREELAALCERRKVETHPSDTFADLFHRLMIEVIEPALAARGPVIVRRFPPSMAALAKLDRHGWADRFELYWNGLEIANAFHEVTDPQEQRTRWADEQAERRRIGTTPLPDDPELIAALARGLPPSGGIALGLERFYMALNGIQDIRELKLFAEPQAD